MDSARGQNIVDVILRLRTAEIPILWIAPLTGPSELRMMIADRSQEGWNYRRLQDERHSHARLTRALERRR